MRFFEFNNVKPYLAMVRVVSHDYSATVRTTITAGSQQEARAMLRKLFGTENVMSLTEIFKESPENDQIQLEQVVAPPAVQRAQTIQKSAQIQSSPVSRLRGRLKRQIPARAIPDQIKHKIIQKRLTAQMLKRGNVVKPTSDDIRIARDEAEAQQKRKDYEYSINSQKKSSRQSH